jgi:beta-N-acetylglucosaminidase
MDNNEWRSMTTVRRKTAQADMLLLFFGCIFAITAVFSIAFAQVAFADRMEGPLAADQSAWDRISDSEICDGSNADALVAQSEEGIRAQASSSNVQYLSITLERMVQIQVDQAGYDDGSKLRNALDPNKVNLTQFADLTTRSGLTAAQIDAFIDSTEDGRTGTLHGMGYAFLRAESAYGVNAAYLVAHAILETGWGQSDLASGYYSDGSALIGGIYYPAGTYYNFYGIGAIDSSPLSGGRTAAIVNDWNSCEAAVIGGAQWIAKHYIYATDYAQQTLYAMKWDVARASAENDVYHEYATDISWPDSIADLMDRAYRNAGVVASYSYILPHYDGWTVPDTNARSMYRLYNPYDGQHLYTSDVNERVVLTSIGWNYEGIGWKAPTASSSPVYRLYNPFSGDHHYTLDYNEYTTLGTIGWNQEGVGWYSDDAEGMPLYRQFNPYETIGTHNYTADAAEDEYLGSIGWWREGIAWYGLK